MKFITTLSYFTVSISAFMFLLKSCLYFDYEGSLQQKVDRMIGKRVSFNVKYEAIIFILSLSWIISR